jgi:hypothetical protein
MGESCHEEGIKCHAHGTSVPQPAGTDHYIRRCFSKASECEKERRKRGRKKKKGERRKEREKRKKQEKKKGMREGGKKNRRISR